MVGTASYDCRCLLPFFNDPETIVVEGIGGSTAAPVGNPAERSIVKPAAASNHCALPPSRTTWVFFV